MEITFENVKSKLDEKINPPCDVFIKIKRSQNFSLPRSSPLYECILLKKQKILKKEKPGKYQFFDDKCLYFDLSKKPVLKGVFFFNFNAKLEFINRVGNNDRSKTQLEIVGIRISNDSFDKEFFSNDSTVLARVMKFLKKRIFQLNFHQNYKALKQLGRGNFATVYKSENILTKEKVAVKAFSKEEFANKEEKGYVIHFLIPHF